jgi:hypothetical protein
MKEKPKPIPPGTYKCKVIKKEGEQYVLEIIKEIKEDANT